MSRPRFKVGDVAVDAITFERALAMIEGLPRQEAAASVHFCSASTVVAASKSRNVADALAAGDLIAPDGMPLVWVGRLLGHRVTRVCGPDLMLALLAATSGRNVRHFLLGGGPGVAVRLAARMRERFPSLNIVGIYVPPYRTLSADEERSMLQQINDSRPDYVWIGLGSPKQDLWIYKHKQSIHAAGVLAVGAAFDFLAGTRPRAPGWMQRAGLEWLFRLGVEPRRLGHRYTVVNIEFVWLLAAQLGRTAMARLARIGEI